MQPPPTHLAPHQMPRTAFKGKYSFLIEMKDAYIYEKKKKKQWYRSLTPNRKKKKTKADSDHKTKNQNVKRPETASCLLSGLQAHPLSDALAPYIAAPHPTPAEIRTARRRRPDRPACMSPLPTGVCMPSPSDRAACCCCFCYVTCSWDSSCRDCATSLDQYPSAEAGVFLLAPTLATARLRPVFHCLHVSYLPVASARTPSSAGCPPC